MLLLQLGGRLLHLAVEYDAPECAQFLVAYGVQINWRNAEEEGGKTAVHLACACRHSEVLNVLLNSGANADICCDDGDAGSGVSPYHIAIANQGDEQIGILARHGADINRLDRVRK